MSKQTEALKLALEALNRNDYLGWQTNIHVREAIREALAEQPAIPQGWKLVPVEPTPEMLKAADDGDDEYTRRNFGPAVHRVMQGPYDHYIAMLNAAPQPQGEQK